jgi:hypothetical protein
VIVYPTGLLAAPLTILVLLIGGYLFLTCLRLTLGQLSVVRTTRFFQGLKELVDPVPQYIGRRLTTWQCRVYPAWVPWAIVLVAGLLAHYALASLIVPIR